MSYLVIRLRGQADREQNKHKTLSSLRLHRTHHATIVPETAAYAGMLNKVEHLVTYGDLDAETATELLNARGRIPGNDPLTDAYVDEHTPYASISDLAQALVDEEADLGELDGIKPVFRLAPARGGFESKKRHFNEGGSLGDRGAAINELAERML